ncbi:hypothetical protein H6G06_25920 [Anabaena sphaerica FACHB-251]|uniref:Uncharacterized protein n=1 Tax=Anabaena sphaerica FACHB-251 TaxID=2692883 RepID=A0A926WLI4_9NOST|nr:hypothetical protein [Anabaena sphaerica FACHB-251]
MEGYDVVLIGAGHNALVCAAYLVKAGYSGVIANLLQKFKHEKPNFR